MTLVQKFMKRSVMEVNRTDKLVQFDESLYIFSQFTVSSMILILNSKTNEENGEMGWKTRSFKLYVIFSEEEVTYWLSIVAGYRLSRTQQPERGHICERELMEVL